MWHLVKDKWLKAWNYFSSQSPGRKGLITITLVVVWMFLSFIFLVFLVWIGAFGSLPDKSDLRNLENSVATEIYSVDSVLLGRYFIQERTTIPYEQISPEVIQALIATEDVRFYNHSGVDYRSLVRVLVKSILFQKESSGGGSTITQQLVKNMYPRERHGMVSLPVNKIKEVLVARRLERIYSKEEILTLYLNTIPFGDNTFGIQSAAERFFSTSARSLSVNQAAVLIGMLKATYLYNPRLFPERSVSRRNVVLGQMKKYNFLEASVYDSVSALPLELAYNKITHNTGLAPYFRSYLRSELLTWCKQNRKPNGKPYNLYTDGLKVYTTIDSRMQQYAEASVSSQMRALQKAFLQHWSKTDPWNGKPEILQRAIKRSVRYRSLKAAGLSEEEIAEEMKRPVPMVVFTWEGEKEMILSPLDSIQHYLKFLNTGLLAMEPHSGEIKAWVGGINHTYFQYDHVRESTRRQVGSTFKPIVYASALEKGIKPCEYISAERTVYTNVKNWAPENGEENYDLKYSMEGALAHSVNTVSVRLLEQSGIQYTIDLARRMGINSDIPDVPSIALGTPSVSIMEMVKAYAVFANEGKSVQPYYLTAIADKEGKVIERFSTDPLNEQVISPENAQLIVHMLKRVVNEGTAASIRGKYGISGDIAGKTGTTQSNADGWFMAITPNLVVGTWVGADDPGIRFRTTALGQGAHTALPVFAGFYKQLAVDIDLRQYTQARFPELSSRASRMVNCDLFKEDKNLLEKLFGKKEAGTKEREFGKKEEKKEGLFKRLFGKKK